MKERTVSHRMRRIPSQRNSPIPIIPLTLLLTGIPRRKAEIPHRLVVRQPLKCTLPRLRIILREDPNLIQPLFIPKRLRLLILLRYRRVPRDVEEERPVFGFVNLGGVL